MRIVLKIANVLFTYIAPFVLIFLLYVYEPGAHWSTLAGFGVGMIGMLLLVWFALRVKKRIDVRVNSLRDIIIKQDAGANQNITDEDFIAVKRKVFLYDKFMFVLPLVLIYFITLYIEKAARSVSSAVAYIALSVIFGAICGFIGQGGKRGKRG